MPTSTKTLDPTKAKTARRNKGKQTFKVGETYLYTLYSKIDSKKVLGRTLITVIDRKTTGKVTTVAVIVVSEENTPTEITRGLRVHDTGSETSSEYLDLFGGNCYSWDREWVYAKNRVTNL